MRPFFQTWLYLQKLFIVHQFVNEFLFVFQVRGPSAFVKVLFTLFNFLYRLSFCITIHISPFSQCVITGKVNDDISVPHDSLIATNTMPLYDNVDPRSHINPFTH